MNRQQTSPAHILLVEDDRDLQASVAEYLTRSGYSVTAVRTGLEFYRQVSEQSFDAAIIDLGLPDIPGMQLVEFIHSHREMPCIIQTANDRVEDRVQGYDSGADVYLVKPVDCRELASVLARLLRRERVVSPGDSNLHWQLSHQHSRLSAPDRSSVPLTFKEFALLACLADTPQQPVTRKTLIKALEYADDENAHRALESLVRRLRRKLELATGTNPIRTCHGIGYLFGPPLRVE